METNIYDEQDGLVNFKNYWIYADMVRNRTNTKVYVPDITKNNIDDHINAIFSILKDGIETDYIHNVLFTISWGGDLECELSIVDYWFNLFMWTIILKTDQEVRPKHIFWQEELKAFDLKDYGDKFAMQAIDHMDVLALSSLLCDSYWWFAYIENFSFYLCDTISNEDDIALMEACPEYDQLMHCSLKDVPFEDVKNKGLEITDRAIEIIKDSKKYLGYDHGLANSFRAEEAINKRQYKETNFNIGTKSNGSGVVYPYIIDKPFNRGGVNDPLSYFIESSTARAAQIMSKKNVGDSGDFARILGLNNTDTILNPNEAYNCMSSHFVRFEIKTPKHLSMVKNRYYRFNPNGMEYKIDDKDMSLVGKVIYLRSPMTCASNSSGHGICSKCYGGLYRINRMINVGKIAAEILTSQLTQRLLSAKHLLETIIQKIHWCNMFLQMFSVDINTITLNEEYFKDLDLSKFSIVLDKNDFTVVDEEYDSNLKSEDNDDEDDGWDDGTRYNEYVTRFFIKNPNGEMILMNSEDDNELYLSTEFNNIIRRKAYNDDGLLAVKLSALEDIPIFFIKINNNEISKTMNDIIDVINKSSVTNKYDKDSALQALADLVVSGGLRIDCVHLEVILSNQLVDAQDPLRKPNWNNPAAQYQLLTLHRALVNNPSIIVSLLYKELDKVLYNPLSYSKNKPSFFDLFFCEQPQVYISNELLTDEVNIKEDDKKVVMAVKVDKK